MLRLDQVLQQLRPSPSDDEIMLRPLELGDYHKGFLDLLGQLSEVGCVSIAQFQQQLERMVTNTHTFVLEDVKEAKIIGTASLVIMPKFLRQCAKAGQVEDVVIDSTYRGKRLGSRLIGALVQVAQREGCYKITLCCSDKNIPFYSGFGFKKKDNNLALYF